MGNVTRYFLLIGFMELTVGSHLGSRGRCWPGLSNWTAGSECLLVLQWMVWW